MRPIKSKSKLSLLSADLLTGLALALWALPGSTALVAGTASVAVQITESETYRVSPGLFLGQDIVPGSLEVVIPPVHGTVTTLPGVDQFLYEPGQRFGMDPLTFLGRDPRTSRDVTLDLVVYVFPSVLPVYGSFYPGADPSYGLYHAKERYFQLCRPEVEASADGELVCKSHAVEGAKPGWYPVYGDWDGDLWSLPSLFDGTRGELHRLAWSGDRRRLRIDESAGLPDAHEALPVAGDWRATGADGLVLVQPSGRVVEIQEPFGAFRVIDWDAALPANGDGSLRWPFAWELLRASQRPGHGDRAAVAWMEPFDNRAAWLLPDDTAIGLGTLPGLVMALDIPIFGRSSDMPGTPTFALLRFGGDPERARPHTVWSYFFVEPELPPIPTTLPLKFPIDPPNP